MDEITLDLRPEGGENAFHLPNLPGEEFRQVFVETPNEASPLSMKIKLTEVHHGTMHVPCDPEDELYQATLLVFEFRFESRLQKRRYQSAMVTLEFFDKGRMAQQDPVVSMVAPNGMHWLNKTEYNKATKYGSAAGLKAGNDIAGISADTHWEVEYTKPHKFKATLSGKPTLSEHKYGEENAARWSMEENKGEKDGIPSFLQAAVLLKRKQNRPFIAKVRVRSEVDIASAGRRSLPVTTDKDKIIDDVTFNPGKVQLSNNSATGLQKNQLSEMEKLPIKTYFRLSLSEQDILTPALSADTPATDMTEKSNLMASKSPDSLEMPPLPALEALKNPQANATKAVLTSSSTSPTTAQPPHPSATASTSPLLQSHIPEFNVKSVIGGTTGLDAETLVTAMGAARAAKEAAEAAGEAAARAADAATKAAEAVVKATEAVKAAVATVVALSASARTS